jgi:hypothetical protein
MATYLRVLPDGYCEHFSRCQFKTAEELAAVVDGLWEMRGSNLAVVAAVGRSASPGGFAVAALTTAAAPRRRWRW